MELAVLVYLLDLVTNLDHFLGGAVGFLAFLAVVGGFSWLLAEGELSKDSLKKYFLWPKVFAFCLITTWLIPNKDTMQYMAGAYLVQTVYEADFTQKAGKLAGEAIIKQLETWAKDNAQVKELLENTEIAKKASELVENK